MGVSTWLGECSTEVGVGSGVGISVGGRIGLTVDVEAEIGTGADMGSGKGVGVGLGVGEMRQLPKPSQNPDGHSPTRMFRSIGMHIPASQIVHGPAHKVSQH